MKNINCLAEQGKLIVADPLGKNENTYRGILILNVSTFEETKELMKSDPAINYNLLDIKLSNWYGSAALPEYLQSADKIWKTKP